MLQRAANNAYSWWWASHIRTKQSKWLEQNLQDMEEKVQCTLKIIDDDGDSFAQRAEMYYRKRPELIGFVEESFRSYRALAERYDSLSRELQSANRTIATVFPERVEFAMDDDNEEHPDKPSMDSPVLPKSSVPKIPKLPTKEFRTPSNPMLKRGPLRRISSSAKAPTIASSGLSKTEALEEIDKLQKGILALQTEKEFVKNSYESSYAKYWEIENRISEMQGRVCGLQDEFGIGIVIEDDEARTLMAETALKSCQEMLSKLQKKQEESAEEAKVEYQRIREVYEKLATLKNEFNCKQTEGHEKFEEEHESVSGMSDMEQEKHDMQGLLQQLKENSDLNSNTPLTVSELAEKINELVDKVVNLENEVSSQSSLVTRLKSETDELQVHVQGLEEDKENLVEDSADMKNKLQQFEEELHIVKNLNRSFNVQNNNLQTHFTEASYNVGHLSEKLKTVKHDEEMESTRLFPGVPDAPDTKKEKESRISEDALAGEEGNKDDVSIPSISVKGEEENLSDSEPHETWQQEKDGKQDLSEIADSNLEIEAREMRTEEEEDEHRLRNMFINGLDDREKILLDEYSGVLQNYRDVRKKLSEVEKKNREGLFELAMQMRELKSALASKDGEIQSLRQKLSPEQTNSDENLDTNVYQKGPQETSSRDTDILSLTSDLPPVTDTLSEPNVETPERFDESTSPGKMKKYSPVRGENENKVEAADKLPAVSTMEEKFRADIDELLEENLEFWLRFSTSFHQIKKFQNSFQDLQAEIWKLKNNNKKQDGISRQQSLKSEARPIFQHLREIQTELKLWLEHNTVLKDELQGRFSSLCDIQEEISGVSNAGSKGEEIQLSDYQVAKFQGEILNMKQENIKIADELQAGLDRVKRLHASIDKTVLKLDEDFGISASKSYQSQMRNSFNRARIPLRSFLFGVKLKKQRQSSIFSCMNPTLQKQYSDLAAAGLPT